MGTVIDAGIGAFKDFEIEIIDQNNFLLKHRTGEQPAIEISWSQGAKGVEWVGLPASL